MATIPYSTKHDTAQVSTESWKTVLMPLASLKLTVALFAASMVIVFVGTLAQDEQNMLQVKQHYFSSWLTIIPFDVFVPQPFHPHAAPYATLNGTPLGIPFPGGALIGSLLLLNLIAAKVVRFKVTGTGSDLWIGVILALVGTAMILGVILAGHSGEGLQGGPPMSYPALWQCLKVGLILLGAGCAWQAYRWSKHKILSWSMYGFGAALILTGVMFLGGSWIPAEPNLRILWQLLQGGLAGVPLLIGFVYIFGRRGANALIHFGVGLLMIGQFAFGDRQLEQRLNLIEGETTNVLRSLDQVELAIIDHSDPKEDRVIAVPAARLKAAEKAKQPLSDPKLPFDIEVVQYMPNSALGDRNKLTAEDNEPIKPDQGQGLVYFVAPRDTSGGANSELDLASAYVRFIDRETKEPIGTYIVSQYFSDLQMLARRSDQRDEYDTVVAGGKTFDIGLRFKRIPKPYWVKLDNVERINYSGSETPRDYSSYIQLVDTETKEQREERIWMNNPLRFRGETFYQSDYAPMMDGVERTGIQVVANEGWMIPYVCCMLVLMGLTVHFSDTLVRFAGRQERAAQLEPTSSMLVRAIPAILVSTIIAAVLCYPRPSGPKGFDFYKAGKIPVSYGGRVMPLDALAQQTLVAASNKATITLSESDRDSLESLDPGKRMSALQWCFEIASGEERVEAFPLFRIDAGEVLGTLGFERRVDNRYSVKQLRPVSQKFNELVQKAMATKDANPEDLTFEQQKLIELDQRIRAYTLFAAAFEYLDIPAIPSEAEMREDSDRAFQQLAMIKSIHERVQSLQRMNAPSPIPPIDGAISDAKGNRPSWTLLSVARFDEVLKEASGQGEVSPALATFEKIIESYREGKPEAFNRAVDEHLAVVNQAKAVDYLPKRIGVERWMQATDPTGITRWLYTLAAVLALVGFLRGGHWLRPTVFGMLSLLLVIHTVALVARIYVTGRPPVINLYSSAVFIGWSLVIAGMGLELIFRTGIGNLVASIAGASTLLIAHHLDDGDTMAVLQAVLDTQFWLSTHVTTVALGYSATFLAGLLGIINIGIRLVSREGSSKLLHDIHRMTYGVVCFGILFSFVGTVLGGLWADDSWGRFWGWDPKENGALLIVIWNALLLHARWDKLVGERGFALLAIGGNVVTAWSWFGTNQLGRGLHSYGFTSGVLLALILFAISQFIVIGFGCFAPKAAFSPERD